MDDPISGLILIARKKVLNGRDSYVAFSKECTCNVEVAAISAPSTSSVSGFTVQSTRERYSRCTEHKLR